MGSSCKSVAIAKHGMLSGKAWHHKKFWGDILSSREIWEKTGLAAEDGLGWWDRAKGMRVEVDPGKCMHTCPAE